MRQLSTVFIALVLALTGFGVLPIQAQEEIEDETAGFELESSDADIVEGGFTFGPLDDELGVCFMADSNSVFVGNTNEEIVWNFLISKRDPTSGEQAFTDEQVAGFMGNIKLESGFDPTAVNPKPGNATGIVQWLGGRKEALITFAEETGRDMWAIETQLDFMWFELSGEYQPDPDLAWRSNESRAYEIIRGIETTGVEGAREAAIRIDQVYERSEQTHHELRANYAEDAYIQFSGTLPNSVTSTVGGLCPDETAGTQIVGDPYTDSADVACAPGTDDLGVFDTYGRGQPIKARLCALNNMLGGGQMANPSSIYYLDKRAVVNSRMSGAWQDLVYQAKADGQTQFDRANSTYRSYEYQLALLGGREGGAGIGSATGSSHVTGVAIDFSWYDGIVKAGAPCTSPSTRYSSSGYTWMVNNAYKWGIKQYAAEAWHWDASTLSNRCLYTPGESPPDDGVGP
ncbi:MAG: phage tail tip lysozyme [Candidatus Saccharimonadales bacterium]|nr:phage tail tip lysozyme [Candidatus Saccharimonadales bacterium]